MSREQDVERERVATVHALGLLDSLPEMRFHALVRQVRSRFRVAAAEINILDEERQFTWAPQVWGRPSDMPRAQSFCDLTIRHPGILVVPDATKDPRFRWKETVVGERQLRFYAGVPLRRNGHAVGTLCIVDTSPRQFGDRDRDVLLRLGQWVERNWQAEHPIRAAEDRAVEDRADVHLLADRRSA